MTRKRTIFEFRKKVIQNFFAGYKPKSAKELQEIFKNLMVEIL